MTFEVMSHSAMYNLAHCQLVGNVASGALWMPMGNPANAFRSDFPVEGRPHSIGKPNMSLCVLYPCSSRHARHLHLGQCQDGGTKRKPPRWRCSKEEVSGKAISAFKVERYLVTFIPQVHPWWDPHDQSCFSPKCSSQGDHRNRVQPIEDSVFLQRQPQPDRTEPSAREDFHPGQQAELVEENRPGFFGDGHHLQPPLVACMQPSQISLLVRTK